MRNLIKVFFALGMMGCNSETRRDVAQVPVAFLGTWVHDEPYLDANSTTKIRTRLSIKALSDSIFLEHWFGTVKTQTDTGTPFNKPIQLGCVYSQETDCVLCGSYRWLGADTLKIQSNGTLRLRGRAYPQAIIFQKIK